MEFKPRELDILEGLARGLSHKQIAYELGLAHGSIKIYMQRMYGRTRLRTAAQAVAVYVAQRIYTEAQT